jgi:hypothetical protein
MNDSMTSMVWVTAMAVLLLAPLATGYFIIQPLNDQLRANKGAIRRFTLLDYCALAVQLQVFFAASVAINKRIEANSSLLITICAFCGLLALWWAGVEAATRARANTTRRRLAIHLLLLPGTAAMMLLSDLALFAIVDHLFSYGFDITSGNSPFSDAHGGAFMTLLVVGGTIVCTLLLRRLARWLSQSAEPTSG